VALLVLVMIPFIVVMGLKHARPLALQFSRLRDAAKDVAEGQFGRQAELIRMRRLKWSALRVTLTP
jgi:sensor histidine kinase YesM